MRTRTDPFFVAAGLYLTVGLLAVVGNLTVGLGVLEPLTAFVRWSPSSSFSSSCPCWPRSTTVSETLPSSSPPCSLSVPWPPRTRSRR